MDRFWSVMLKDGSLLTFGLGCMTYRSNAIAWARRMNGIVIGPK